MLGFTHRAAGRGALASASSAGKSRLRGTVLPGLGKCFQQRALGHAQGGSSVQFLGRTRVAWEAAAGLLHQCRGQRQGPAPHPSEQPDFRASWNVQLWPGLGHLSPLDLSVGLSGRDFDPAPRVEPLASSSNRSSHSRAFCRQGASQAVRGPRQAVDLDASFSCVSPSWAATSRIKQGTQRLCRA